MKVVNTVPHAVRVVDMDEGSVVVYKRERDQRNCSRLVERLIDPDADYPIMEIVGVANLPDPEKDTVYIVSKYTALYLHGKRSDLVFPDGLIRDEKNKVNACQRLARFGQQQ
jgi:hypothetical protein